MNTVADNKSRYTNNDYMRASLARKLHNTIGRPSEKDFTRILESNMLPNCPITKQDVLAARDIFGPDVGALKGKTVRHAPNKVRPVMGAIPMEILDQYKAVTLCGDIMFINRIPFFITLSRNIKFGTGEMLVNRTSKSILESVYEVYVAYTACGDCVSHTTNTLEISKDI